MHVMTFIKLCVSGDAWTLAQKLVCMCDYFYFTVYDFCRDLRAWEHPLKPYVPPLKKGSGSLKRKSIEVWSTNGKLAHVWERTLTFEKSIFEREEA